LLQNSNKQTLGVKIKPKYMSLSFYIIFILQGLPTTYPNPSCLSCDLSPFCTVFLYRIHK